MKAKHALLIIAIAFCLDFVAVWCKITHQAYADKLLFVGISLKVIGVLVLVVKIINYEGFKKFMNK